MSDQVTVSKQCPECAWAMEATVLKGLPALAESLDLEDRLIEHIKTAHPDTERS